MRLQSDQVTKAMREQARTSHEMSVGRRQMFRKKRCGLRIRIATTSMSADRIRSEVIELRQITNRNADGVKATLTSTSGLADRARQLGEIMDSMVGGNGASEAAKTQTQASTKNRPRMNSG